MPPGAAVYGQSAPWSDLCRKPGYDGEKYLGVWKSYSQPAGYRYYDAKAGYDACYAAAGTIAGYCLKTRFPRPEPPSSPYTCETQYKAQRVAGTATCADGQWFQVAPKTEQGCTTTTLDQRCPPDYVCEPLGTTGVGKCRPNELLALNECQRAMQEKQ